jgi:hypothetical protein
MSHYCKLKAMKEFNKGIKPFFFHFTSDRYIKMLLEWNFRWQKRIIICYFNAYSVSIRFQELKDSIKQLRLPKLQFLFQPFLRANFS